MLPPSNPLPLSSSSDGIYDLNNPMQGRVSADGHVGATKVIVN